MFRFQSLEREPRVKIRLGYDFITIFSGWYQGQGDPLYAVISRRGNSVDWVELEVTVTELAILIDTAQHIIEHAAELLGDRQSAADVRVAKKYLPEWENLLQRVTLTEEARSEQADLIRRRGLSGDVVGMGDFLKRREKQLCALLRKHFPTIECRPGSDFDKEYAGSAWVPNASEQRLPPYRGLKTGPRAFNWELFDDPEYHDEIWGEAGGVHVRLLEFAEDHGLYWDTYNEDNYFLVVKPKE